MEKYKIGDHLVSDCVVFTHHGIYVGNDMVINYQAGDGITISTIDTFGKRISVRKHSGNYTPEEIVDRAYSRLGEAEYNLLFNNCESFATWCCNGKNASAQVFARVISLAHLFFG